MFDFLHILKDGTVQSHDGVFVQQQDDLAPRCKLAGNSMSTSRHTPLCLVLGARCCFQGAAVTPVLQDRPPLAGCINCAYQVVNVCV